MALWHLAWDSCSSELKGANEGFPIQMGGLLQPANMIYKTSDYLFYLRDSTCECAVSPRENDRHRRVEIP